MRIFVALDIDEPIRERITTFMDAVREFAPDARWVRSESLHVTLKFVGEQPQAQVENIQAALSTVHSEPFSLTFRGFGFFPNPNAARVFWIGIESGPHLAALANAIDEISFTLGVPKEAHPYSPHLTLARGGSGSPRRQKSDGPKSLFLRLQKKLAAISPPEFGTMTAREFSLYQSQTGPGGSRYTKLHTFPIHSSENKT